MKKAKGKKRTLAIGIIIGALLTAVLISFQLSKILFFPGTMINNTDCSFLTINQSKEKIENNIKQNIIFRVVQSQDQQHKEYFMSSEQIESIDLTLVDTEQLQTIMKQQRERKCAYSYFLSDAFEIQENKVKEYLYSIPELNGESMLFPKNAHLIQNEMGLLEIIPETLGNYIEFEEAFKYAIKCLKKGNGTIDFSSITQTLPTINSRDTDLIQEMETVNSILLTTIHFKLGDESIVTLDSRVMREWVYKNEEGKYAIDIDGNIPVFIKNLEEKAKQKNSSMVFRASDIGNIVIPIERSLRLSLNKEEELAQIKQDLGTKQTYVRTPTYQKESIENKMNTYIELDITRQTVWMYVNGECILKSDCVTGNVAGGHSTPTGIFFLSYKTKDAVLRGYNNDGSRYASPVKYWMPFNGGIGFHDASWRKGIFGGEIYKTGGSHGCVNMPLESAKILYENINKTIPIVVYES